MKPLSTPLNIKEMLRKSGLILAVAVSVALLIALFLGLLKWVGLVRWQHLWIISLLPVAGVVIHWLKPPLLFSTLITHLFGGSAGRESVATEMGESLADSIAQRFKCSSDEIQLLIRCGAAAGFGAVFGTPLTGAIFAVEDKRLQGWKFKYLLPCLFSSIVADVVCRAAGATHSSFFIRPGSGSLSLMGLVLLSGVAFGAVAVIYARLKMFISVNLDALMSPKWLIPVLGSAVILGISFFLGTFDYLGLGVSTPHSGGVSIGSAFVSGDIPFWGWMIKLLLTAITLGSGFKGGEITPLFFMGATLGNTLAVWMGVPIDLFAGLGFIAVFAGFTRSPVSSTVMGLELFGLEYGIYFAVVCWVSVWVGGVFNFEVSKRS
jgi:H+/Cl- antiporter ClcA